MDLASSIAISSVSVSISGVIVGSISLFNGARRNTVDMLSKQHEIMKGQIEELQKHTIECERQLAELRSTNAWLTEQIKNNDRYKRGFWRLT